MNLALDGCGLVYIIVHRCIEHMDRQTTVARDMERDAPDLALSVISCQKIRVFYFLLIGTVGNLNMYALSSKRKLMVVCIAVSTLSNEIKMPTKLQHSATNFGNG